MGNTTNIQQHVLDLKEMQKYQKKQIDMYTREYDRLSAVIQELEKISANQLTIDYETQEKE